MRYYKETDVKVNPTEFTIYERGRGAASANQGPLATVKDSVFADRIVDLLNADEAREGR